MIEKYGLFDSLESDVREYAEVDFARLFCVLGGDGVRWGEAALRVSAAASGLTVTIQPGMAMVRGRYYALEDDGGAAKTLNLAAAVSYPRIDRIVLTLDYAARTVALGVLQGTEAATPKAPELTRDSTQYMLSLAQVYVGVGAATLTASGVTDERADAALCGLYIRTADEAYVLAGAAKAAAASAQATADGATSDAANAQSAAESAMTAAQHAQTTAEQANIISGATEGALVSLDASGKMVASGKTVSQLGMGATFSLSGSVLTITTV